MSVDEPFRWMLVVGLLLAMPVGLYHRIRSQASGEPLDRRQEGWFVLATLRPIAFASLLGTLAFIIHPDSMTWSQLRLPTVVRWCGVSLGITTAALLVCVFRSIGNNITDTAREVVRFVAARMNARDLVIRGHIVLRGLARKATTSSQQHPR